MCLLVGRFQQLGGDPEWARRREERGKKGRGDKSDSESESSGEESGILQRTGQLLVSDVLTI